MFNEKSAKLDKNVPIPLYFQLKTLLLSEIKNGNCPIDTPVPTEKEFSQMFGISRTTVRQAINELAQEGWLYRMKSKGTFVTRPKINQDFIKRIESFNEQIIRSGRVPSSEVLFFGAVPASQEAAEKLRIAPGEQVLCLHRKRSADNVPIVSVCTYLPYEKCKALLAHDFSKESLYESLAKDEHTKIYKITRVLEAVAANSDDVALLHVKKNCPIHFFTSVGTTVDGVPIEYSLARYRGDQSRFEIDIYLDNRR